MPYQRDIERGSQILKLLEYDRRVALDYGIPLASVVYRRKTIVSDETFEPPQEAVNIIEEEAQIGNYGAFALRWYGDDEDKVEVWVWNPE